MLKILFSLLGLLPLQAVSASAGGMTPPPRGAVLEMAETRRFTAAEIDAAVGGEMPLVGPAACDVTVVSLRYATVGVRGEPADASAVLLLPGGGPTCEAGPPLLGWARGTETRRAAAQSEQAVEAANFGLSAFFAAKGYAVVATDYLGLGTSGYPFHPYLHADSEATAVIDALRAAREAARTLGRSLSEQVMLGGYSQGGHAAMAAQREIERSGTGEFKLAASAPMAGPYELSKIFEASWSGRDPMAPLLLSYTLLSYQRVYGGLYERPDEIFRPSFAGVVEGLFPGPLALFDLSREPPFAGAGLDELRQPAFTKAFLYEPHHPFREALRRNDLTGWTPRTPTMLCGSKRDAIVPFGNALRLAEAFREQGAPVTVVDVDDRLPGELDGVEAHAGLGAYVCYGAALRMFEQIRTGRGE